MNLVLDNNNNNESGDEGIRQLILADRIIINKMDLVKDGEDRKKILVDQIRTFNVTAPILFTERSQIDLESILDIKSYGGGKGEELEKVESLLTLSGKKRHDV